MQLSNLSLFISSSCFKIATICYCNLKAKDVCHKYKMVIMPDVAVVLVNCQTIYIKILAGNFLRYFDERDV